jgi:carbamoyltransferase
MLQPAELPCVLHSHATSWHDGGVAVSVPGVGIVALASERVGDRYKHSWDSRLAYEHLKARCELDDVDDRFVHSADGLVPDDHHRIHAAHAFFASPFDRAAILVVDGQGSRGDGRLASTTIWSGSGGSVELVEEHFTTSEGAFAERSIGHFYTAVGALAGMTDLHQEGKTMALAAYGARSPFLDWLRERVHTCPDGRFAIDPSFTLAVLGNTLGPPIYDWPPQPEPIQRIWEELQGMGTSPQDVAYAGQRIIEEILLGLAVRALRLTGATRLCVTGGVALNCVANGLIARDSGAEAVYVPSAPGDDGQALGKLLDDLKRRDAAVDLMLDTAYLGPPLEPVEPALRAHGITAPALGQDALCEAAAALLADGKVVATCYGRSELGPRALGHRSILADPRDGAMREHLNQRVKDREWYRPVAPVVIAERAAEYFELTGPSPFMSFAAPVLEYRRAEVPAVVHVDGSARLQTLTAAQDPLLYRLLRAFERRTGVPILINTSFNRRDEPLVETPADALDAFFNMGIDALVVGDRLVVKP